MALPSLKFPKIISEALSPLIEEREPLLERYKDLTPTERYVKSLGLPEAKLEVAPPKIEKEASWFRKIARFILPKELEYRLGITERTKTITSDLNRWYYNWERYERAKEIEGERAQIPKGYKEPEDIGGRLKEAWKKGKIQMMSGIGAGVELIGTVIGGPTSPLAKLGAASEIYFEKELARHPEWQAPKDMGKWEDPLFYATMAGEGLPTMLAGIVTMGLGFLAAGPPGAVVAGTLVFGTMEGGMAYQEAKEGGASEEQAQTIGSIVGGINGAIETIFPSFLLFKAGAKPLLKTFNRSLSRRLILLFLEGAITEGVIEEGTQTFVSNIVAKSYDESRGVFDGILESMAGGALLGGPFGVVVGGGVRAPVGLTIEEVGPEEISDEATDFIYNVMQDPFQKEKPLELSSKVENELSKYKPTEPILLYRGIPKEDIKKQGELIYQSWTHDKSIAEDIAGKDGLVLKKIIKPADIILDTKRMSQQILDDLGIFVEEQEVLVKAIKPELKPIPAELETFDKKVVDLFIKRQGREAYEGGEIGTTLERIEQKAEAYDPVFLEKHPEIKGHDITVYHDPIAGEDLAVIDNTTNKIIEIFDKEIEAIKEVKPELKELEKEITKQIIKKRFTLAQRLAQKEKAEARLVKERIESISRGARKGVVITKRGIKEIQEQLLDILNKSDLSLNDKAKFRATIKNIQTAEQLQKALPEFQERIEALAEAGEVRTLKSKIKAELRATKPKRVAGKIKGKFTPDIQKVLDAAREGLKLSQAESAQRIIENLEKYQDRTYVPVETILENRVLSMFQEGVEGLKTLLNTIREIKETGMLDRELQKFNYQEQLDRKKNHLLDILGKIPKGRETTGKLRKTKRDQIKQFAKTVGHKSLMGWDSLLEIMEFAMPVEIEKGQLKRHLKEFSVYEQEKEYKKRHAEYVENRNKTIAEVYDIPFETIKEKILNRGKINQIVTNITQEVDLGTFKNIEGTEVEMKMSRDEIMRRYIEFQDPTLEDSFREGNHFTHDIMDSIRSELSNKEILLAERLAPIFREQYPDTNEIFRKQTGVNLGYNENYIPIKREGYKIETQRGYGEFISEAVYRKAINPSFIKARVKNLLAIEKQGLLISLERFMGETNWYVAWAEKIRELDSIFTDPEVRATLEDKFGSDFLGTVQNTIQDLSTKGNKTARRIRWLDKIRKGFTFGQLMLKPVIGVKQLVSDVVYLERLGPTEYMAGVVDFWSHPVENYKTLAEESVFIRTRGSNMDRDIRDALETEGYKRFSKIQTFLNLSMLNIKLGDKGGIIPGAWAMRKAGLKQRRNIADIIKEYEDFSADTQQSADISQQSEWQRGGSTMKLFTWFKSALIQYSRKEVNAVRSLFRKEGTSPKNIKRVARIMFIYHFLVPFLFEFVSNFGGWDEDDRKEYLRAIILGPLDGIAIMGDAIQWVVRSALGLYTFGDPIQIPAADILVDFWKAFESLDMDEITAENVFDAVNEWSEAGSNIGIPSQYAVNIGQGIADIVDGDTKRGIALLLGWSEYYLREPKTKVPPGIKTEGMKLPSLKFKTPGGMPSLKFPKIKMR